MISTTSLFSGALPLALFLAKATVLLVLALVATSTLWRGTAGARHLVWLAALVGVLALPLLSRIESLRVGILPSALATTSALSFDAAPTTAPANQPLSSTLTPPPDSTRSVNQLNQRTAQESAAATPDVPWIATVAIVWAGVAFGLIGWLVAGAFSVRRIVRNARELTSPDWNVPLCEVADRLDLVTVPRLVLSDRIEMAFACRAMDPTIVLPAAAESWTDDRRRAVLFHELAHVKRHDLLGHALGRLACALYWFHPLVWTAAKHLRAESERACDDLVLTCGARPSEYAQHLLDMVTNVRDHGAPIMALPMARKKEFEGRMLAILDPAVRRASPGRVQAAVVVATLSALSLTIAAVAPATATPATATPASASPPPERRAAPREAAQASAAGPTATPDPQASAGPRPQARPNLAMRTDTKTAVAMRAETSFVEAVDGLAKAAGSAAGRAAASAAGAMLSEIGRELLKTPAKPQGTDSSRVSLLIRVLGNDGDASVRRSAAWALNNVRRADVRDALLKALQSDTDPMVREMSAWALADYRTEDVVPALGDVLSRDKSAKVRATAAWAIGTLGGRSAVDALEVAISDPSADVRQLAIWAIGHLNLRTAPPGLTDALTDDSREVRTIAAWTLSEIGDRNTARAVANAMQNESSPIVRRAELRALALMRAVTPEIIDDLLKSNDPELRRSGVSLLAGGTPGEWVWPWPWPWPRPSP